MFELYYPIHAGLPKAFRVAVGERILDELAECLRHVVLANGCDKRSDAGRKQGAAELQRVRAGIEVIRGFWVLAWKMKFISHAALGHLNDRLELVSRQATRWQQWFDT